MNLMMLPNRARPMITSNAPAIIVQMAKLAAPYLWPMPARMTMNAAVGPPITTREPPRAEMMKPAMMAVKMPCSGLTPVAMPKAIASGNATTPTVSPATKSCRKVSALYCARLSKSLGRKRNFSMTIIPAWGEAPFRSPTFSAVRASFATRFSTAPAATC